MESNDMRNCFFGKGPEMEIKKAGHMPAFLIQVFGEVRQRK